MQDVNHVMVVKSGSDTGSSNRERPVTDWSVECLTDGSIRQLVPQEHNVCRP